MTDLEGWKDVADTHAKAMERDQKRKQKDKLRDELIILMASFLTQIGSAVMVHQTGSRRGYDMRNQFIEFQKILDKFRKELE